MATEVKIPAMGESISSGILAAWHVKDGDYVEKDQAIYELETDKITSEANAEVAGIITLNVAVDDEVDIGQVVATIDESAAAPSGSACASRQCSRSSGRYCCSSRSSAPTPTGTQHPLSPAARKAAEETGVNTRPLAGSGKDGRVTKSDILAAARCASTSGCSPSACSRAPAHLRQHQSLSILRHVRRAKR